MNNKGNALDKLGKPQEAIVWYDKVLSIDKNDTNALLNKGNALDKLGKPQKLLFGLIKYYPLIKMIPMPCLTKGMH